MGRSSCWEGWGQDGWNMSDWSSDVCSSDLEEGRIGFYQKPLTGQARRRILKVARVLERHDPRYGDKKTEFQSLVGEILAGGEAMDHAGERALPHFFGEEEGGILLRIARVDD